jgi:dihydroneopterin aldolase
VRLVASPNEDIIRLKGITSRGRHGVYDWEREGKTTYVVDIVCHVARPLGSADELSTTVDYDELASRVKGFIEGPPVKLIETLAGQIAESILTDPLAVRAEVTVHKWIQLSTSVTDISATATRTR